MSNHFKPHLRCYCEKNTCLMSYLNLLGGEGTNNTCKSIINTKLRNIIHNTFLNMFETLGVLVIFLLRGP